MKKKSKISTFFEVFIVLLIIAGLFSVVITKYYGNPRAIVANLLPHSQVINGYSVNDVIDVEELELRAENLKVKNMENGNTNTIPILVYHGISPEQNGVDITVDDFQKQMFALKEEGYQTITLDELYQFMRGEIELPEKSFIITFDDGRKDSYYFSDDTLRVLNYSAVMFIVAKYSLEQNHPYYLNKKELLRMKNSGRWEIEAHSYDGHSTIKTGPDNQRGAFFGNKMWIDSKGRLEQDEEYKERITGDLVNAKTVLKKHLDINSTSFAIPFSDFGQYDSNFIYADRVNEEIYPPLFDMVFYQYKPIKDKDFKANYNDKKNDFYFVMRNTIDPSFTAQDLLEEIEAMQEVGLPYEENFDNKKRWLLSWGDAEVTDSSILLKNNRTVTSTQVYLDGSYLWKDYGYSINLKNRKNQNIALLSRFQNVENYATCTFNGDYVSFDILKNGKKVINQKVKIPEQMRLTRDSEISMRVIENEVQCIIDGESIITTTSPKLPSYGGVGLKTWISALNRSGISEITSINIYNLN